jgi:SAM-dependent methyltransferase
MFEFHRYLLADEARTNAFREAIGRTVRPGDVVLDIGSGTGILAFFACDAGARRVYAVEQQHSADAAALLARQHGYADRVTIVHGRSTDVVLPEMASVLVTETFGPLVFNIGFLGAVVDARRRLLRPDARMIPSQVDLWAAPVEIPQFYANFIDWWSTPRYGLDISQMRLFAANTAYSSRIAPSALLAPKATAMTLISSELDDTAQRGSATFRTVRRGVVHGFAIGFSATLAEGIVLSNAWSDATTWDQGVLPLEVPVETEVDTPISVELRTDDGKMWHWRGSVGDSVSFAQTTLLSRPPCVLAADR